MSFSHSEIRWRRSVRSAFVVGWREVTGVDVRTPDLVEVISAGIGWADGSVIRLDVAGATHRFHVAGTQPGQLRETLMAWVVREAPPSKPWPVAPARPVVARAPVDIAYAAAAIWRASGLGRAPFSEITTASYRVAVAENHRDSGRYSEAIAVLEPLAQQCAEKFGADQPITLQVRNALGRSYCDAGYFSEGLEVLNDIVSIAEHVLGVDDDMTLTLRNNLALGYSAAGEYRHALDLLDLNVDYSERKLGDDSLETLGRRNNLAATQALAGLRQRAAASYWSILDRLHPDSYAHSLAVTARQNLAILHNPLWEP
ncbi:tetratricopeptide repeat protein [Nocardia sp. NPDC055049]